MANFAAVHREPGHEAHEYMIVILELKISVTGLNGSNVVA